MDLVTLMHAKFVNLEVGDKMVHYVYAFIDLL